MAFSSSDFLSAFQALLPRGAVWPREPEAVQTQALAALMPTWSRLAERDENLLVDAFPATTDELLPEWEASLGLPDPCAGESPTIQQRQAQVLARFAGAGGQSIAYLTSFAAQLGFAITIQQFAPARAGLLRAGQPAYGTAWAFAWQVTTAGTTTVRFRAGASAAGEPLGSWESAVLQCELQRLGPAHTTVIFAYSSPTPAGAWGTAVWVGNNWA